MWKRHINVFEEHLDFLKAYVQNPYKYLMLDNSKKMRTWIKHKKYLHPPIMRGKLDLEADLENPNAVVPERVTTKLIWDGLHETMQDELDI